MSEQFDSSSNEGNSTTPRSAIRLVFSSSFGIFFLARLSTSIGTWLHSVVAAIAVFEATGSAFIVGIVSAVQFIPQILLGPLAGRWTDSGNIKFQMILGRVILCLGSFALAVWYLWLSNDDGFADALAIILFSLIFGIGLVIGGPAMQSAAPLLVSRDELPAAMALNAAPQTVGRIAGPAFGALATALFGYGYAMALGALLSVFFIALIGTIHFPVVQGKTKNTNFSMREALRFVRGDKPVLLGLIAVTAVGMASEPIVTLAPAISLEFGGDEHTVGALVSAMGIGAGVGVIVSSAIALRVSQTFVSFGGMLIMAVSLGICAIPLTEFWVMIAFGVAGFGFIVSQTGLNTIMQYRIPAILRGRVMALWLIGFVGSRPLGALFVGVITDLTTVFFAFAIVAVGLVIVSWFCRPSQISGGV